MEIITTKMQTNILLLKSNGRGEMAQYEPVIELTTQNRNLHAFLPNTSNYTHTKEFNAKQKVSGEKTSNFCLKVQK